MRDKYVATGNTVFEMSSNKCWTGILLFLHADNDEYIHAWLDVYNVVDVDNVDNLFTFVFNIIG